MNVFQQQREMQATLTQDFKQLVPFIMKHNVDALLSQFLVSDELKLHIASINPLCPMPDVSFYTFIRFKGTLVTNNWDLFHTADIVPNYNLFKTLYEFLAKKVKEEIVETKKSPPPKPKAQKPRKKSIPAAVKRLVWNKHVGEEVGKSKCLCWIVQCN